MEVLWNERNNAPFGGSGEHGAGSQKKGLRDTTVAMTQGPSGPESQKALPVFLASIQGP